MSYGELIKFQKDQGIGILILDNAKKMNVIGSDFFDELAALEQEIEQDTSLRAIVILADGEHFSAGIDLKFLSTASSAKIKNNLARWQRLYNFWQELPIPVIIGVQGYCFGSAVELMLGCDIRVVAENAKLSLPEARLGLSPDMGGTAKLTKLVGAGQAKLMLFTCDEISAQEALRIGLAEKLVETEKLREETLALAKKIIRNPASSIRFAKKGVNVAQEASLSASMLFEEAQSTYCCGTHDLQEAIAAFLEKRKPEFTGE